MKKVTLFMAGSLLLCLVFLTAGCKTEPKAEDMPIPSSSFKLLMVKHPVANFTAWKAGYMAHDSVRQSYGLVHYGIGRGTEDTSMVLVVNKFTDVAKAKEFSALPNLQEVMQKAGVTGPPTINYIDVIRDDTTTISQKNYVMVSHRVKDFDTFLKVFDGEGRSTRAANGIIDRGMARDIDDPNTVYLVFAISDKEKAMARIASEELKKLMADAGLDGPPTIFYFTIVD